MGGEPVVYADLLHEIKKHIRHAQVQAVLSANKEMILLYWAIGFSIAKRQIAEGWGAAIIPRLAKDIKNDMPEIKGFSERNLKRMIRFYREYPFLSEFVPQAVAQLETATVDGKVIIECKATTKYNEIFEVRTLTYLRLTGLKLGNVINFGERLVKDGIHRVVNGL